VRPATAAIVVFLAAGAVLLLEILAVRVMAPYVGVSLNTYTGIIGTVLAGISAGAWVGGWAADHMEPRKLLGPLLIIGGILAIATAPLATELGKHIESNSLIAIVGLAGATVFLPAFVLSSVHPIVVKMQLQSLNVTGSVVGRLSAFATAGALVGTFGTGFFLTAHFPTRAILAGVGGVLIAAGALVWWRQVRRLRATAVAGLGLAVVAAAGAAASANGPCKVESAYACIQVKSQGPYGRLLILDDLPHSFADIRSPRHLIFDYARTMGALLDTFGEPKQPISVLTIGGGAFTLPRYVAATRRGSENTVMEIDPAVVDTARQDFGVRSSPRLRIEEGDARLLVEDELPQSYDVVIGDAFSGHSVPWQLTTKEFLAELKRLLRPGGLYMMNFIDTKLRFVRAEAATLRQVFSHVVLFELEFSSNRVLVASDPPIDLAAVEDRLQSSSVPAQVVTGAELTSVIGDARILEDDFAPVDQLLK
jgi:spermidine synthase